MGYTAECDLCGGDCDPAPGLLCQFSPQAWRATPLGGHLQDQGYDEGDTVTFCRECTIKLLS